MSFKKVGMYLNEGNFTRTLRGADILKPMDTLYIHEPVKLPKYVADDIQGNKDDFIEHYSISTLIEFIIKKPKLAFRKETLDWFKTQKEPEAMVMEAILYGYEIEDEK